MSFLADLDQFHFLRPALLWLILPAALACWALARMVFASGGLQKLIDPDLLPHLLMRGGEKRPWLFTLIFALLTVAIVAIAGPTWRKLPTPVYSNQDALVILLDLSPSMMATDLSPNRLTRARLKILDILRQRKDGLTALVAYAGEAHVVTPLTDDTATIANLVPSLSPRIMPVPGSNIEMAVQQGLRLIKDGANGKGRLLAVTDGIAKAAIGTIKEEVNGSNTSLSILAVGSGDGSPIPKNTGSGFITDDSGAIIIANFDRRELSRLAQSTGGEFSQITVDDRDIARVTPKETAPDQAELTEREFDQWYEEGPWLVLLLLPFALLLFRRGSLACALPVTLTLATLTFSSPNTEAAELKDLWQTPNQQGRDLLEQGNPKSAAEVFENSQWRGTAQYRAGEYDSAAKNFAQSNDPQGLYNLGNSLTQQGRFDEAIKAYDEALQQNPELADAKHNRDIAKKLKELQQKQQQNQQSDQQQSQNSDQQQQDQQQNQQNQDSGEQSEQQQNADQDSDSQQSDQQQSADQQNQQQQNNEDPAEEEQQQQAESEQGEQDGDEQEQSANARPQDQEGPLDPETQQALDQWLRQIPDDPAGLMREKFKYESLQRRRAYRSGEWQPPENGATQRW
ncbi:VWA domain-containing protein [Microbulbifer sp. YPW1]|uniref:VWA domain-containing protein n=1 Tax=Microbulbifer sp. YPW1 TaxID=2745199 RepID=UPI001598746A|nr:VWA domain-containing protein [Microbulbifer sp. YPW1]QKX18102.1 VWA domain-containing protein [Microbulbifer sp. YPW1]